MLVKRDDKTHPIVGCSKLRMLSTALPLAQKAGAERVICVATAGSTLVAAAAVLALSLRMKCLAIVRPQLDSRGARRNLSIGMAHGCEYVLAPPDVSLRIGGSFVSQIVQSHTRIGHDPFVIPFGAGIQPATLAYVDAGREAAAQLGDVEDLEVWVACGSGRLAAGLAAGFVACGQPAKIVAVAVTPSAPTLEQFAPLIAEINESLSAHGEEPLPASRVLARIHMVDGTSGEPYGAVTREAAAAAALFQRREGWDLDTTYVVKVLAALLAARGNSMGKTILVWISGSTVDASGSSGAVAPCDFLHSHEISQ